MKQGNFAEARGEYAQARAVCEEIGDRGSVTEEVLQDGNIDAVIEDVAAAERKFRQGLALARQRRAEGPYGGPLLNLKSPRLSLHKISPTTRNAALPGRANFQGETRSGYDASYLKIVETKIAVALRPEDSAERTKALAQLLWFIKTERRTVFGIASVLGQ